MIITELAALIKLEGVKNAVSQLKEYSQNIQNAAKSLYDITAKARDFAMALDSYHINTGMSTEQLQQLSFTASKAGVSMGELGATIEHLQNLSAKANLGEGWSPVLSRFGIMPGQDPVAQLNKITAALKRMHVRAPGEARQLAHEVGISDRMYYVLLKADTEEMNKQFILTRKEQDALVKLNFQWNKVWFYIKQITMKIHALGAGLQTKFVDILVNAVQGFGELAIRLSDLISSHKELQYIIGAIVLILNPWLAVLGAIGLILEDIFVYFQGGSSITGRIVDWCKQSEEFRDVWLGIKTVFEGVILVFKSLKGYWDSEIKPMLDWLMAHEWFIKLLKTMASQAFRMAMGPLGTIGETRQAYNELTGREAAIPSNSSVSTGDVNVTTTVNMTGSDSAREDGQIIANTVSQEVESSARQNSYLPYANRGTKYEPAT